MLLKLEQEQQSKATIENSQQRKKNYPQKFSATPNDFVFELWHRLLWLVTHCSSLALFFLAQTTIFLSVLFHSSKELMNQPVSMPCGHSACKACLLEIISKQSIGSRPCICPLCEKFHWNKLLETFTLI